MKYLHRFRYKNGVEDVKKARVYLDWLIEELRNVKEIIVTNEGKEYSVEEIKHSSRITKSQTPKGTLDWYLKWVGSLWLIVAIAFRSTGIPELQVYDMLLSFAGTTMWAVVGFMWSDRAIIVINAIAAVMLLAGLFGKIFGG